MKILRNIYNQIGFVLVIVLAYLFYTHKIDLSWYTGIIIVVIIAVIMILGKIIPAKK